MKHDLTAPSDIQYTGQYRIAKVFKQPVNEDAASSGERYFTHSPNLLNIDEHQIDVQIEEP